MRRPIGPAPASRSGPTATIFETLDFNYETVYRRIQEYAFLNRALKITLRDERADAPEEKKEVVFCYENGIADFVRHLNATKTPIHRSVVEFGADGDGISLEIAMQWNESYGECVYTFANTINTHEGGTHEEGFRSAPDHRGEQVRRGQEVPQGRREAHR